MTHPRSLAFAALLAAFAGCRTPSSGSSNTPATAPEATVHNSPAPHTSPAPAPTPAPREGGTRPAEPPPAGVAVATFAGGCFWCMEAAFEQLRGVRDAVSGYTGGAEQGPTYEEVSNHQTSHAEAIRVLYDPAVITYDQLLDTYWRHVDPTTPDQAFVDVGHQYRSVIFVHGAQQRAAAERSKQAIVASGRFGARIVTTIEDASVFWVAEDYHQNFWRTSPERYHSYHEHSGRREFIRAHWGPDAPY